MIEIKELTKYYGKTLALDRFSYCFHNGVYALLGPNGSGKTTLLNLITDNIKRTSGEILFGGRDIIDAGKSFRSILGYMPQNPGIYPGFTCEEFLLYMAELKEIPFNAAKEQTKSLLNTVELEDVRKSRVRTLSGGMKQRLALAQAFLGNPKLIILDEPTAGLDPRQRIGIRTFISANAFEKTVIYSTHVVSDVDTIAKECIFLKKGVIAASGSPESIVQGARGRVWTLKCKKCDVEAIIKKYAVVNMRVVDETAVLQLVSDQKPSPEAVAAEPELQDAYLVVFGQAAEETS